MYRSQISNPILSLTDSRITRIKSQLRQLTESTLEDYQVDVYSAVNGVLNLDGKMQPLKPIAAETPAIVGDVNDNLNRLTEDSGDLVTVISRTEDTAAKLYNLAATTQNQIRQMLREGYYASNAVRYVEPFLNDNNIQSYTATLDYAAGQATLAEVASRQILADSLSTGPNSTPGSLAVFSTTVASDKTSVTSVSFTGKKLEIIATFATPVVLNRIRIELDNYAGLELSTLTASPDGTVFQDILNDLGATNLVLNGISGKMSGDTYLDFPPRYVSQLRIVLTDRVGTGSILLSSLTFWSKSFSPSAELTTSLITVPSGKLRFTTDEDTWGPYTNILHQISDNGVHFTAISPGDLLTISKPFYYRASLQRIAAAIQDASASVAKDPAVSSNYILNSTSTVNLGSNLVRRTLNFGSISGPVTLQESPLPGTFRVMQGSALLDNSAYSFNGRVLSFSAEVFSITVTYQISTGSSFSAADCEPYYTPVLRQVLFETV